MVGLRESIAAMVAGLLAVRVKMAFEKMAVWS
jgi:hypothetical protein